MIVSKINIFKKLMFFMPFFLVNKPKGYTSHDIVEKFRKIFFSEKV